MKCSKCIEEGRKSKVFSCGSSTTLMHCSPFYDEDGEYHYHDLNTLKNDYKCSNGHRWTEIFDGNECWCGWNKDRKVKIVFE